MSLPVTIAVMRRLFLPAATILALAFVIPGASLANAQAKDALAPAKEESPDVPDSIQAPAGEDVILLAHATGSQIYTCAAEADGKFIWTLKAPEADLHDRKDKIIGTHF